MIVPPNTGTVTCAQSWYATEHVAEKLRKAGLTATALHGDLSQGARTQALADFKAGRVRVLLATDVAARGLDIARLPDQIKGYGHVKARHLAAVRSQWERLMKTWRDPGKQTQAA